MLLNPFIKLWIGDTFLLSNEVVFVIIFNFYLMGIRRTLWVFTNTLGLFYHFRYMPFIEITINLIVSIVLLKKFGIVGVFLGTMVSTIVTYLIREPYVLYKNYFECPIQKYFIRYFIYMIIMFFTGGLTYFTLSFVNDSNWKGFFIKAILTIIIVCSVFCVVFYRTKEFKYYMDLVKNIVFRAKTKIIGLRKTK